MVDEPRFGPLFARIHKLARVVFQKVDRVWVLRHPVQAGIFIDYFAAVFDYQGAFGYVDEGFETVASSEGLKRKKALASS
jgi:hypothetical protein